MSQFHALVKRTAMSEQQMSSAPAVAREDVTRSCGSKRRAAGSSTLMHTDTCAQAPGCKAHVAAHPGARTRILSLHCVLPQAHHEACHGAHEDAQRHT